MSGVAGPRPSAARAAARRPGQGDRVAAALVAQQVAPAAGPGRPAVGARGRRRSTRSRRRPPRPSRPACRPPAGARRPRSPRRPRPADARRPLADDVLVLRPAGPGQPQARGPTGCRGSPGRGERRGRSPASRAASAAARADRLQVRRPGLAAAEQLPAAVRPRVASSATVRVPPPSMPRTRSSVPFERHGCRRSSRRPPARGRWPCGAARGPRRPRRRRGATRGPSSARRRSGRAARRPPRGRGRSPRGRCGSCGGAASRWSPAGRPSGCRTSCRAGPSPRW